MARTQYQTLPEMQEQAFGAFSIVERGAEIRDVLPNRYWLGMWTAKTCPHCSFVYLDKAPDYEVLLEQMDWSKSAQLEQEWRAQSRPVLHTFSQATRWRLRLLPRGRIARLLKRSAKPGNVIDLGCGRGGKLDELPEGFVPHGIEISREDAKIANARFSEHGGHVVNASCLEGLRQFPDNYFTAAKLRSYLEHEAQPAVVLRELHRTLTDGGVAIIKVPNFGSWNRRVMDRRWCGFRHPDHVNYFTPETLRAMGERNGYRATSRLWSRLPTSDNMYAVFSKISVLCFVIA